MQDEADDDGAKGKENVDDGVDVVGDLKRRRSSTPSPKTGDGRVHSGQAEKHSRNNQVLVEGPAQAQLLLERHGAQS